LLYHDHLVRLPVGYAIDRRSWPDRVSPVRSKEWV
jgi:hypothetical protein